MADLESVKSDVADLLIDVAKRRKLEAAKRRRRFELEDAQRVIKASRPVEPDRIVMS